MKIGLEETYSMVVLVVCGVAIWSGVALLATLLRPSRLALTAREMIFTRDWNDYPAG